MLAAQALVLVGCTDRGATRDAIPADSTIPVADASGVDVRVPLRPTRVLSLIPAVTRTIVELGAADVLVGRTDYDTLSVLRSLPSVGGGLQPDLERMLALAPDFVVRFEGDQDRVTGPALDRRGVPNVGLRTDRIDDVRAIVVALGKVLGREPAADSLLRSIDAQLDEVRGRVTGAGRKKVVYVLGGTPPWVAGPGTYIADLIELAGGVNVFGDLGALYAPVSLEELVARDVDMFLVGAGTAVSPRLAERAPVVEVSADLETPGTGLGRSAFEFGRALHPDRFR